MELTAHYELADALGRMRGAYAKYPIGGTLDASIVAALTQLRADCGREHRVTSPYEHPPNGQPITGAAALTPEQLQIVKDLSAMLAGLIAVAKGKCSLEAERQLNEVLKAMGQCEGEAAEREANLQNNG